MTLCASLSPNHDPAPLEWIKMIARLVILGPLRVLVTSFSALKWFSSLKLRAYWVEVVDLIPDNRVFCMNTLICIYRYCEMTEAKCVQASLLSPRNDLQRQGCSSRLIVFFRYICWFSVLTDLTVPQTQSLISRLRSSLILDVTAPWVHSSNNRKDIKPQLQYQFLGGAKAPYTPCNYVLSLSVAILARPNLSLQEGRLCSGLGFRV